MTKKQKTTNKKHEKVLDKKNCFIIMPFTKAEFNSRVLEKTELDFIYKNFIYKAVESYRDGKKKVFVNIGRNETKVGSIISDIVGQLNESELVIADLTGLNANVTYELGVRHSLRKGTIVISQDIKSIPSDLRDYMFVTYNYSNNSIEDEGNYKEFEINLHKAIDDVFSTDRFDSPVLSYLKGKEKYWREDEVKKFWHNRIVFNYILETYTEIQSNIEEINQDTITEPQKYLSALNAYNANIENAVRNLDISVEAMELYECRIAAENLLSEINKSISAEPLILDYFSKINAPEGLFDSFSPKNSLISALEKQYTNTFLLKNGEMGQITLKEIFSDEKEFYSMFLDQLWAYLLSKAEELGITDQQIEEKLKK